MCEQGRTNGGVPAITHGCDQVADIEEGAHHCQPGGTPHATGGIKSKCGGETIQGECREKNSDREHPGGDEEIQPR